MTQAEARAELIEAYAGMVALGRADAEPRGDHEGAGYGHAARRGLRGQARGRGRRER